MLKYAKIVNEETKEVSVGLDDNPEFYKSIGMEEMEVEESYNNLWYVKGYAPVQPVDEYNEQVRQTRQQLFTEQSDPLKFEYEECVARYGETDERTIKAKNIWLAKKDEIRENNPYRESVDIVD